jgi:hypothetical protein
MSDHGIFLSQFAISLVVYGVLARWFLMPWSRRRPPSDGLIAVMVPLLVQHVAMTTLAGSVVNPGLSPVFGWTVTACNLVTIPVAVVAIDALRRGAGSAWALSWLLTAVGVLSTAATVYTFFRYDVIPRFGPHWYVGAFYVPLQALAHLLVAVMLLQRGAELRSAPPAGGPGPQ